MCSKHRDVLEDITIGGGEGGATDTETECVVSRLGDPVNDCVINRNWDVSESNCH